MMTLDKDGNYYPWVQPAYGTNAKDKHISPPKGYKTRKWNTKIGKTDIVFDVYSGWMKPDNWHYTNGCYASSSGRWTTWAELAK